MAAWDPRARALFGCRLGGWRACRNVGSRQVEAIAFAAPVGPFGVLARSAPIARPWYDDHPEAKTYPIFHVLRAVAAGGKRRLVEGLPKGLAGVAVVRAGGTRMVIANLSGKTCSFELGDVRTFGNARLFDIRGSRRRSKLARSCALRAYVAANVARTRGDFLFRTRFVTHSARHRAREASSQRAGLHGLANGSMRKHASILRAGRRRLRPFAHLA